MRGCYYCLGLLRLAITRRLHNGATYMAVSSNTRCRLGGGVAERFPLGCDFEKSNRWGMVFEAVPTCSGVRCLDAIVLGYHPSNYM
jgi:hypothetical protein